jgi:hypothetical protein
MNIIAFRKIAVKSNKWKSNKWKRIVLQKRELLGQRANGKFLWSSQRRGP